MQNYLNVEYLFYLIYSFFLNGGNLVGREDFFASEFYAQLVTIWGIVSLVATLITLVLLTIFLYSALRLRAIRAADEKFYEDAVILSDSPEKDTPTRWQRIEALYNQGGESNWRQAILDADIMLDDMLTHQGYRGDTIGEKLKSIEPSDFTGLQYAWAAHKVRNEIAHKGQDFILTEREAKQAMRWFKAVFAEFHYD